MLLELGGEGRSTGSDGDWARLPPVRTDPSVMDLMDKQIASTECTQKMPLPALF